MATPNYSFEKRQRELAKKRKAEEKRQKKASGTGDTGGGDDHQTAGTGGDTADPGTQPPATPPAG